MQRGTITLTKHYQVGQKASPNPTRLKGHHQVPEGHVDKGIYW